MPIWDVHCSRKWVATTWNSSWNLVHLERPLGIFQLGIFDLEFHNLEFLTLGIDLVGIFYLERLNLEFFTLGMDLVGIFYLERMNLEFFTLEWILLEFNTHTLNLVVNPGVILNSSVPGPP